MNEYKVTDIVKLDDGIQIRIYNDNEQSIYEEITNNNIKSIVTYQNFKEMEYKINEKI